MGQRAVRHLTHDVRRGHGTLVTVYPGTRAPQAHATGPDARIPGPVEPVPGIQATGGSEVSQFRRRDRQVRPVSLPVTRSVRPTSRGAPGQGLRLRPVTSQPAHRSERLVSCPRRPSSSKATSLIQRSLDQRRRENNSTPGRGPGQGFSGCPQVVGRQRHRALGRGDRNTRICPAGPSPDSITGCPFVTPSIHTFPRVFHSPIPPDGPVVHGGVWKRSSRPLRPDPDHFKLYGWEERVYLFGVPGPLVGLF
jgi:hypothetical protein